MTRNHPLNFRDSTTGAGYFFPGRQCQPLPKTRHCCDSEGTGGLGDGHNDHHPVYNSAAFFTFPFPSRFLDQVTKCTNRLCRCGIHLQGHRTRSGHEQGLRASVMRMPQQNDDCWAKIHDDGAHPAQLDRVRVMASWQSSDLSVKRPACARGAPPLWVSYPGFVE